MYLKKKKIRRFSKINRVELVFCIVHNCFTPITFRWSDSTRTLLLASETLLARAPQMKTRFEPPSLMKIQSWSRLESWKWLAGEGKISYIIFIFIGRKQRSLRLCLMKMHRLRLQRLSNEASLSFLETDFRRGFKRNGET